QNEIAEPQRMGQYLILIQNSGKQPVPVALFDKSVERLRTKGGNPGAQAGANRVDVALHWMYRACLISDPDLLKEAMDYIYSTVVYTTGAEGIQPDHSFTQHGRQLHIGAYGDVYIGGTTKACSYAAGTTYAISGDQLDILVRLVKDTYLSTFRGEYISYNVIGRSSTRPNATKKTGQTAVMSRMKMLDPANAASYDQAIARISGLERPEFMVKAESNHFYRSDYTLHKRPQFTVDLRLVSTRTARNEYLKDNGEGIKQYFLSDGSTGIFVNGDEYSNIFPVWNYAKVPGVTCPEFTEIPQASTYIKMGQSSFVGGVTDSVYSVSAYKYSDFDTQFGVNTSANKAWFFFDKEVVCLGNGIESASEYQVNTTLNQCLLKSDVTVSENGVSKTLTKGDYNFDHSIDWAYHNGVGYFFPQKANIDLSLKEQTGKWTDINTNYSDELVKQDVFSLSVNHGIKPDNHSYAYVLLPGMNSISDMHTYNSDNIEIIANTDSIQAVYHKGLNIYGIVFYKAGGFNKHGLIVEADAGCIVMVQDADKESVLVSVSDPTNGSVPVNLGVETSQIKGRRLVTYKNSNLNEGRTLKFVVSQNTPVSSGRDQLLNRSKWTITTSINGPKDADALVGGDNPDNIIDNDTKSAFLFVKPGKSFSGINATADYVPAFEIDRNGNEDFEYFIYRHRDYNNTLEYLRAQNISLYGKNIDSDEYQPIIENKSILTSVSENKVELAGKQICRYLKLTINEWDKASGSTIQVADFNIGNKVILDIPETGEPTSTDKIEADKSMQNILLIPNQVRKGEKISIRSDLDNQSMIYDVYDLSGLRRKSGTGTQLDTNDLHSGIYLIQVKDISQGITGVAKFIVR
ncbi:MAG: polysaccharide lyase family 8 super-sandwich domain-containing protein, partial [Bacteroidales bacterium]